MLALDIPF